jgi:hypothetical protein
MLRALQELPRPLGPPIQQKILHRVKHGRTQLALLFAAIYFAVNRLELFKHPSQSLITDIRM